MRHDRILIIVAIIVIVLLLPFLAMQYTDEVNWSSSDFLIMGSLLLAVGLVFEVILSKVKATKHKLLFCGILLAVFFLIWAEIAVGIFGTPLAGS